MPEKFSFRKTRKLLAEKEMFEKKDSLDWATAELLAYATLLMKDMILD